MYGDLYCDQQGGLCCTDALSILHFAKLPDTSVDKNQPLAPAGPVFFPFFLLFLCLVAILQRASTQQNSWQQHRHGGRRQLQTRLIFQQQQQKEVSVKAVM